MSSTTSPDYSPLDNLPRAPASDVKKLGWRGVMDTVRREGPVLITNHERPEAVIVPVEEYERLQQGAAARHESVVEALRREYDERLACLNASDAGETLRNILREPLDLGGEVLAGQGF